MEGAVGMANWIACPGDLRVKDLHPADLYPADLYPADLYMKDRMPANHCKDNLMIWNETTGRAVCRRGRIAGSIFARMRGLLGSRPLTDAAAPDGLLLQPSSAIHTLGMTFAIDAVALDRHHRVVGLRSNLVPRRVALFSLCARAVLELPAGQIDRASIRLGDQLIW